MAELHPLSAAKPSANPPKAHLHLVDRALRLWRLLLAVARGYRGEALGLRAGNLTFITITSLVPMVALIVSLVHALNEKRIEHLVASFFDDILAPAGQNQSVDNIRKFLRAAPLRTAGGLSFLFLLVSAGLLLRHLDASLNDVWAVRRKRPLLVSVALYGGILILGPILMAVTLVGSDGIKRLILWLQLPLSSQVFELGAVASASLVYSLLYKLAPHAPVRWRSAFIGGISAGLGWELARHAYGSLAAFFFSANPVYGSLGIAPLFLMWVYVGWYLVLAGARLAYAVEHSAFHDEFKDILRHPRSAELIAARIAELATRAMLAGAPGPSLKRLAEELRLPAQRIADSVHQLEAAGLVATKGGVLPTRPPSELTLADISAAVGGAASLVRRERASRTGSFEGAARLFTEADEVSVEKLSGISWSELSSAAPGERKA